MTDQPAAVPVPRDERPDVKETPQETARWCADGLAIHGWRALPCRQCKDMATAALSADASALAQGDPHENRSTDGDVQTSARSVAAPDKIGRDSGPGIGAQVLCESGDASREVSSASQAGSEPADSHSISAAEVDVHALHICEALSAIIDEQPYASADSEAAFRIVKGELLTFAALLRGGGQR